MKINEFRELEDLELQEKLYSLKEELFSLHRRFSLGQVEKPQDIKKTRKDIARCFLVIRERQLGIK
jgi:large subunit ribosomal protein L29